MPPFISQLVRRTFDFGLASREFSDQFKNPSDIFSVLLLLGGASDPVGRALAQISGSRVTPVAFSFGWVSFMLEIAVGAAVGEIKLMPRPDYACQFDMRSLIRHLGDIVLPGGNCDLFSRMEKVRGLTLARNPTTPSSRRTLPSSECAPR
ncbi:hypothetical protein ACQRIU_002394 [Beauveria bassiana]